jgi:hypothetical protein
MKTIIKQEYVFEVLDKQIEEGNSVIGELRKFIAESIPKSSPEGMEARKRMGEVLVWFINLFEAWQALSEKE